MATGPRSAQAFDVFMAANMVLFVGMCWLVYYDRFIALRGSAYVTEFFVYACVIVASILIGWRLLRRWAPPSWLLLLIQAGILLHFAGAFFPVDGGRLYDAQLLGLRFDKLVHAYNAFGGAALLCHLLGVTNSQVAFRGTIVTLAILGAGGVVEIVEFLVTLTVPHNGVGTYDNNMGDMIANLAGATAHEIYHRLRFRFFSQESGATPLLEPLPE